MIYEKEKQKELINKLISSAEDCLIFAGAGMGVDSGLKVFRGNHGLWSEFPDAKDLNFSFADLANPQNYIKHPEVVMPFYIKRYESYRDNEPHQGFKLLLNYVEKLKGSYFVTTSNVDGHFQKSGFNTDKIYEIHGSISNWQCTGYSCSFKAGVDGLEDIATKDLSCIHNLVCKRCGDFLRPNLLMFYDIDWISSVYDKQSSRKAQYYYDLQDKKRSKTLVIEIGAGTKLRSIRSESEAAAYDLNTHLIRIDPGELETTEINDPNIINIQLSALEGLQELFADYC